MLLKSFFFICTYIKEFFLFWWCLQIWKIGSFQSVDVFLIMTSGEETKHQVLRKSCYQESFSSPVSTGNTCGHLIMMKLLQATINFSVSRVILHFFLRNKLRLKNCFFFQISLGLKWRSVPRGWLTKEHPLLKFPKIRANYLRGFGYSEGSRGALLHRHGKSRWQGMQKWIRAGLYIQHFVYNIQMPR